MVSDDGESDISGFSSESPIVTVDDNYMTQNHIEVENQVHCIEEIKRSEE